MRWVLCLVAALLLLVTGLALLRPECPSWPPRRLAHAKCKEYYDAAHLWARFRGELPASLADMNAPLRPGESAFEPLVDDPWGHPYVLERGGTEMHVRSLGPDGAAGTEDDIVYPG